MSHVVDCSVPNTEMLFHSQANDKMKRWNDYYDSMSPKKTSNKTPTVAASAHPSTENSHRFSMFSRKLKQRNASATPNVTTRPGAAETSFQPERYVPRKDEIGSVSTKANQPMPESNFAWVD